MKYLKYILSFILLMTLCYTFNVNAEALDNTSIYMWDIENIDYSAYSDIVNQLKINKLYTYIGTADLQDLIDYDEMLLFEFAKQKNMSTYLIYDENYLDQSENKNRIKEFIDEINKYNKNSNYKIKGLTIDSEFHSLEEYQSLSNEEKVQLFKDYVNAMIEAKEYANSYNLEYVVCIPVWLNKLDLNTLDMLIKDGSDYVQLMNYTKNKMVENIAEEVTIAKKYNKPIENIAEFQKPGLHEVDDTLTFYNDGVDICNNKFEEIYSTYNYNQLTFSYHYFKPIYEIMNNTYDYSNKYEYELYPKDISNNSLNVKNVYLVSGDEKHTGLYLYNSSSKEYIIRFYDLDYNKEYNLLIEDENYELVNSKIIMYNLSTERIKYDETQFKIKEKKIDEETKKDEEDNNNIINNEILDIDNITEKILNNNNENNKEEVIENPKTGSTITIYIFLYIISMFACIIITIYNIKGGLND